MNSAHLEEQSFIEIECPTDSNGQPFVLQEVQTFLDRVFEDRGTGTVRVQTSKENSCSTVQIRCTGGPTSQWDMIKDRLREEGLLEETTVYQHHPALKGRTQIWP